MLYQTRTHKHHTYSIPHTHTHTHTLTHTHTHTHTHTKQHRYGYIVYNIYTNIHKREHIQKNYLKKFFFTEGLLSLNLTKTLVIQVQPFENGLLIPNRAFISHLTCLFPNFFGSSRCFHTFAVQRFSSHPNICVLFSDVLNHSIYG